MTQIEKIEAILKYFECKEIYHVKHEDYLREVFLVIDKLKENPDKYLAAYKNYLEFVLPLLQRTTIRDSGDKPELEGL